MTNRIETIHNLRTKLVNQIADEFEQSGIEYTCGAIVMQFARKRIIPLTDNDEFRPYLANRLLSMRRIERETWNEVHRRWERTAGGRTAGTGAKTMTINRYTVADTTSRSDIETFPHTPEGLEQAKNRSNELQQIAITAQYVVLETKLIFIGNPKSIANH